VSTPERTRGTERGRLRSGRKNGAGYQATEAVARAGTAGSQHRVLLQRVVDAALDAVIVMDAGGLVAHWNKHAEVIFGWTQAEALGQPLVDLVIPSRYRAAHTQGLQRFLETGEGPVLNRRVELVAARRDGHEFPVELTVTPFTLDGKIAFTGFVRDITERKRADERLARQLLEAQLLHQATTLAATSPSLEDALRRCIEIVCRMTGWPIGHVYMPSADREELIPTTIWHLAEDGAHAAFRAVTERTCLPRGVGLPGRVWQSGEPEWIEDLPAHKGFARAHLLPELGLKTAFAFPVAAGGETLAILEFFTGEAVPPDPRLLLLVRSIGEQVGRLIERRRAEDGLREREARFRTLADTAPVLIWVSGPDKACTYVNKPWLAFTGRRLEQELGFGWAEGVHPEDHGRCLRIYEEAFKARQPFSLEYRLRRADGDYRWILGNGVPLLTPGGEFRGYIGSAFDITERKQTEERLTTLLAEKEILIREIHHRVKNNLQLVGSLINLQCHEIEDEGVGRKLMDLRGRIGAMVLVHQHLYSVGDASALAAPPYVRELAEQVQYAYGREGISLAVDVDSITLCLDTAVPLGLIIGELLANAFQHAFPAGRGGAIRIALHALPDGSIRLAVSDDGQGLPGSVGPVRKGALGLHIVEALAAQIGARFRVLVTSGTTFELLFEDQRARERAS
jgi:two-component system, sensor histidine kinase PdtaS